MTEPTAGAESPADADHKHRWARWRDTLRGRPMAELVYRVAVGVFGVALLVVGIIAIPYPGPGIAICFVALAILASEFEWARRLHSYARRKFEPIAEWFGSRGTWGRLLGSALTGLVVVASLWLFGVLGWTAGMLGFERDWLNSPIGLGS